MAIFRTTRVSCYQNAIIILHFIGARMTRGVGDNWSYKTCKAPVESMSSPPAYQHSTVYRSDDDDALPVTQLCHSTAEKSATSNSCYEYILCSKKLCHFYFCNIFGFCFHHYDQKWNKIYHITLTALLH